MWMVWNDQTPRRYHTKLGTRRVSLAFNMNPKRSVILLLLGTLSLAMAQQDGDQFEAEPFTSNPAEEPKPQTEVPQKKQEMKKDPQNSGTERHINIIEIETPLGPVQGMFRATESGNNIYAFMGLPYAEPPLQDYRFTDPFPKAPWINPVDATAVKPLCLQTNSITFKMEGQEDCLYLNIYSPKLPHAGSNARDGLLLPVVVFIHGMEHFTSDTSSQWNPELMVEEDVVVVTLSYRLGVFGFLNINHPLLSGNQGLKDQLEALRWIRQNIHVFGGDGKRLTLMGHGSGAISVDLHRYSYQTRDQGLFHSLIMQSGSALSLHHPMMKQSTITNSQRFAEEVGCNQTNPNDIVECLQAKPAEELLEMSKLEEDPLVALQKDQNGTHFLFLPSLDPLSEFPYMTELPFSSLMKGDYEDLPNIRGMTQDEGGYLTGQYWDFQSELSMNWTELGSAFIFGSTAADRSLTEEIKTNVIKRFYVGTQNFSNGLKEEMGQLFTDIMTMSNTLKSIEFDSINLRKPSYLYLLSHKPSTSLSSLLPAGGEDLGVIHGDDLSFLFKDAFGIDNAITSKEDKETSKNFIRVMTNFIKYQDPTPFVGVQTWVPVNASSLNYLDIMAEPELKDFSISERRYFWQRVYWDDVEAQQEKKSAKSSSSSAIPLSLSQGPTVRALS